MLSGSRWRRDRGARRRPFAAAGLRFRQQPSQERRQIGVIFAVHQREHLAVRWLDPLPHQPVVAMLDVGRRLDRREPRQEIAEIRIRQPFVAAADEQEALGHSQGPHRVLDVLVAQQRFVGPDAQHHRFRIFPMSVQVQNPPVVASQDLRGIARIVPGHGLPSRGPLDQVVVVRGDQRQLQGGQPLDDRRIVRAAAVRRIHGASEPTRRGLGGACGEPVRRLPAACPARTAWPVDRSRAGTTPPKRRASGSCSTPDRIRPRHSGRPGSRRQRDARAHDGDHLPARDHLPQIRFEFVPVRHRGESSSWSSRFSVQYTSPTDRVCLPFASLAGQHRSKRSCPTTTERHGASRRCSGPKKVSGTALAAGGFNGARTGG
jgi:hypothetical protein